MDGVPAEITKEVLVFLQDGYGYTSAGEQAPLAEMWNGTTWVLQTTPGE